MNFKNDNLVLEINNNVKLNNFYIIIKMIMKQNKLIFCVFKTKKFTCRSITFFKLNLNISFVLLDMIYYIFVNCHYALGGIVRLFGVIVDDGGIISGDDDHVHHC